MDEPAAKKPKTTRSGRVIKTPVPFRFEDFPDDAEVLRQERLWERGLVEDNDNDYCDEESVNEEPDSDDEAAIVNEDESISEPEDESEEEEAELSSEEEDETEDSSFDSDMLADDDDDEDVAGDDDDDDDDDDDNEPAVGIKPVAGSTIALGDDEEKDDFTGTPYQAKSSENNIPLSK